MRTTAPRRGFTLVEVLASITVFTLIFLSGFAGMGKLLVTQDQNFARTVAASSAMIIANWHHAIQAQTTGPDYTKSLTNTDILAVSPLDTTHLLAQIPAATINYNTITWSGYDFTWDATRKPDATKDIFCLLNNNVTTPSIASLDLRNPATARTFATSEYDSLLICISPASAADSKLTFRQLSFWYGPPQLIQQLRQSTIPPTMSLALVGRFLLADTYGP